jgi:hypothetical protein
MQPDTTLKGADDPALWVSFSELARRKGITPQSVSERIARLGNKIELRPGRGRERLVNIAQFDQVTGENSFLPQTAAAATVRMLAENPLALGQPSASSAAPGGRSISDVQREKLLYDTGLTALKFAEARSEVLPIGGEHGIEQATRELGDAFRQAVGRLHMRAAEAVAVGAKDGVIGMRALLKSAERDILRSLSTALAAIGEKGKAIEAAGGFAVDLSLPDEIEGAAKAETET